jgi:hypothetical protein
MTGTIHRATSFDSTMRGVAPRNPAPHPTWIRARRQGSLTPMQPDVPSSPRHSRLTLPPGVRGRLKPQRPVPLVPRRSGMFAPGRDTGPKCLLAPNRRSEPGVLAGCWRSSEAGVCGGLVETAALRASGSDKASHRSGSDPVLGLIQLIQPVDLDFAGGHPGEHPVRLPTQSTSVTIAEHFHAEWGPMPSPVLTSSNQAAGSSPSNAVNEKSIRISTDSRGFTQDGLQDVAVVIPGELAFGAEADCACRHVVDSFRSS